MESIVVTIQNMDGVVLSSTEKQVSNMKQARSIHYSEHEKRTLNNENLRDCLLPHFVYGKNYNSFVTTNVMNGLSVITTRAHKGK